MLSFYWASEDLDEKCYQCRDEGNHVFVRGPVFVMLFFSVKLTEYKGCSMLEMNKFTELVVYG